ncbi:CDP-diacylglycerol--glycerol-3-phosphate 3-phosphatidyltransferase, mitochondrial isoform X2 [Wyeomyia smithii]|uniref:CDP-diacylglycerol--glycerol-3-phosphate 3-phosphatidyltransferase, mitochondrial isoform X2 n=1 Tax=Wyeomyia smithii TaxID=174621 RepID=UPI002467F456|nr:CDP-diacylglycerol--glycerol-3-phosphate 3-phosphatidyltransferase, mitochondrial isoform X2 [Wyeomyia smithii]
MALIDVLFSWQLILQYMFKMIRRLFSTFITDCPPTGEFLPTASSNSSSQATGSSPSSITFRSRHLDSLNWLYTVSPCFPLSGNQVDIIYDPDTFYNILVSKCATAKRRIMLASLYLGVGKLENRLVDVIHDSMRENLQLKVDVLLDFSRGTRGEKNSKSLLMPLLRESDNFRLSLYHTPVLRGLTKRLAPPRWNELLGIQHMKLYLVDDTIILSGANLSNDYFTNRQDRYVMIEDHSLADFYANFIGKVQEFSLKVNRNGETKLHENWNMLPYKCTQMDFAAEAKDRIRSYFKGTLEQQRTVCENDTGADTWVFPLIEMGQLEIHHDSLITKNLLSNCLKGSQLKLATGYFNLTETYMKTITNDCEAECNILMAHPNANGFLGAKGPAGGIPAAYSLIARKFHENLKASNQQHRVSLMEYERPGWTYHAKGLWYYLPGSCLPDLTLFGSSNFGERSVNRDLEAQICMVTMNKNLQRKLQTEYENILQHSSKAEAELLARPVPRWVRAIVGLFRNFF